MSRTYAALSLVTLVGSGLYGTLFWLTHDQGPGAEAFPPAAAVIRNQYQPGDLILLVPHYATRARQHLGDLHPVASPEPLSEDFGPHPRVWVLGLFGEAEKLQQQLLANGFELLEHQIPSEGITVDLYRNPRVEKVVFDFVQRLKGAKVFHEKDGQRIPCAQWHDTNGQGGPFGRWACPYDAEWFYVSPQWHRMDQTMRWCLWAHPPSQGRLLVQYYEVPLTGLLTGRAGHTANGSLYAHADLWLDVEIGNNLPQRFVLPLHENWLPFGVKTATVGTATVTFAVSTPDAGANHFCFSSSMRSPW